MKATIRTRKDARGRRISLEATIGPISGTGPDRAHAIAACHTQTLEALERLELGTTIGVWQGHTWIVSPTITGWRYWLDTFSRTDYFCEHGGMRHDAIDHALRHLAQTVWTFDVPDDQAFVKGLPYSLRPELLDYFAWQREYRRLTLAGRTDLEARAIIGGYTKETEATI